VQRLGSGPGIDVASEPVAEDAPNRGDGVREADLLAFFISAAVIADRDLVDRTAPTTLMVSSVSIPNRSLRSGMLWNSEVRSAL